MIIDSISKAELKVMLPAARAAVAELEKIEAAAEKGCRECRHFANSTSFCLHHRGPVPQDFQPQGCDDWRPDPIPF